MNKKKKALDGVKFEKQIHYKYKEKFGERIEYIANEIEILYNKKGDISEKIFDNNNRIVEEFTFNYDYSFGSENEKLIERITFEYD